MFTKAANRNQTGEVGRICLLDSMVKEVWSLCLQSDLGGHRGLERTLNKFLQGFFMLSARPKLRFLNRGWGTCLVKERNMPVRMGIHKPSLTGYVGKKLYIDLVSMSDTTRGNRYLLTAENSFIWYCHAYPIPNKEVCTVAKVLVDQHLFSEFKIQHTTTLPYNPSSNPVERFHKPIIAMLRTRGEGIQDNWDPWINASLFAYNTTVSTSTGITPYYAMFGREGCYL